MKKMTLFALFLIVLGPVAAQSRVTAIKAGKLVDPATGETSRNQVILIEGPTIKAMGPGLPIPAGAAVIDLSSSTVLPGLFDCHTHMCLNVRFTATGGELTEQLLAATLLRTTAYRAIQGVVNAREMLEAGFTTIRDVGNAANYADSDLRRAIEEHLVPGPTIINAGRIIAPYGGQFPGVLQPEKRDLGVPEYLYADTKDELKRGIRENILYGAKVIKIVVDDQPYIYSVEDIRSVVEETTKAGLKVAAHCVTEAGAHNAAEAGVTSIEHGFAMSDETLELAKRNNVVLVGTDFSETALREMGFPDPKTLHANLVDRLKRAYRIGVKVAYGTDVAFAMSGQTRGTLSISFIESFVEAGVPASQILRAMTTNAAQLLGVEYDRGSIKPGFAADIIATPNNPLDDIRTLKQVSFVMKEGRVIKGLTIGALSH